MSARPNPPASTPEIPPPASAEGLWPRLRSWLPALVALLLTALVLAAMRLLLREVSYAELVAVMRSTPASHIGLSLLATAASYLALMGYDWSGLRYVGAKVPPRVLALASFSGYALGNTVGLGVLTGGAVRLRLYAAAGVDTGRITQVIAFIALSFGGGIVAVGAAALLWGAEQIEPIARVPAAGLELIAAAVLVLTAVFIGLCAWRRELMLFGRWNLRLPGPGLAAAQLLFSALDIVTAAAALWFLLPQSEVGFPALTAFYAIAITLGVISHVPGGLGVFEAVILLAYRGHAPLEQVAGALVLYRAIYFLLPLFGAVGLLAWNELRVGVAQRVGRAATQLTPLFLSTLTFVVGVMLLISGVTPATDEATELLALKVPIEVVEAAHFLGSIAGLALLFVARGLLHRLDAAWWTAVLITALNFWLALPKGVALSEMAVLGFLLLVLLASRREFDRRASLFAGVMGWSWLLTVGIVVAAVSWLLFFVYEDVPYTSQLWWQFQFDAHAPRGLRALLAVVLGGLGFALWQLFRPASGRVAAATAEDLLRAAAVLHAQPVVSAGLALTGDKSFLFSESGKSFIMFGKRNRSWVSLYDPVGQRDEWPELVWRFIEMADAHGGRAVFYQVPPEHLALYLDAGLRAYKLGEYASVDLTQFSTKGSRLAHLRHALSKGERDGLSFQIVPPADVPALLPQLRIISDAWLEQASTREKAFSLGAFIPDYLSRFPMALALKDGRPVAFANLLATGAREEIAVDLMRYGADAPRGAMDYLFVRMLLHYQAEGYRSFGLGMAPLSGFANHPLAPRWHRIGSLLFGHGEPFYNFQGLRAFKEKFAPQWEPRYLCTPGGLQPVLALMDTAALAGGGLRGVIAK
ncbi:bifunctional lysylphosphatidylglycerol flippase/synthetase MprF [Solimonas sp. K1W22B-7]|uniref:bifunctional lysylphosphatidylglycerol flippase/synthetase MprF n=1 Tax=Solimonas sp. K1W22B-7 TaxID=2303331 RepID=UPI000E3365D5|nr:bifunctional lysylphosphatidylglycerol flippase/synthetase MprF [Solimonas sp. K1W22B-7]AXQ31228.1 bifunctional lysylphosphatidylglycerol flippase/synthetase MprF [Solimonas sp. K1W22B-7]